MRQTVETAEGKATGPAAAGLVENELTAGGLPAVGRPAAGWNGSGAAEAERKRVEAVVETLANLQGKGESLAEVAHDTRNMVTALGLYCDLLEEPGVLNPTHRHYANELRLVATASRRLVEKLLALDLRQRDSLSETTGFRTTKSGATGSGETQPGAESGAEPTTAGRRDRSHRWDLMPAQPIDDLAGELMASRNLLSALAGPSIALVMEVEGGALPVHLTGEDLTRILVNLIKNAAEAMPEGGRIQLGLRERTGPDGAIKALALTVEDNGPGIPNKALDKIFDSGYSTRAGNDFRHDGWPASHRGLGLSITRSIVEAIGGGIHAANRAPTGAHFEIELPVRPH